MRLSLTQISRRFCGWLFGFSRGSLSSQPQSRQPVVFKGGYRVQSSTYKSLPIVYGTQRIAGNILCFLDFTIVAHQSGGKGFGSGAYTNTFTERIITGLCQGPIVGIQRIWKGSGASTLLTPALAASRYDIKTGTLGQVAEPYIVSKHPGYQLGYSGIAYAWTKNPEDLGTSTQPPQFNWEVQGLFIESAGNGQDANPADIIIDVLTNQQYGLGTTFQSQWIATLSNARAYFTANNLLLSVLLDQQKKVQEILKQIADIANGDFRWTYFQSTGYQLDFIPYGDQTVTNNGVTFTPNLTPTYCFTDNDFIAGQGSAPIEITVKQPSDVNNRVGVEFLNRANNYDPETVYREEQDDIQNQGLRTAAVFQFHEVSDPLVATNVAQMRLQREQTIINEYRFSVGFGYCLSDPLDIIALCDSRLGLGNGASEIIGLGVDGGGAYATLDPSNPLPVVPNLGDVAGAYNNFTTVLAGSSATKVYLMSTSGMQAGQWLGINPVSVRTTQITEREKDLQLEFIAEDLGVNTAQLYATQPRGPQTMGGGGSVPVSINPPVIFEPTVPLANISHGQGEIWFAISGENSNESWGGYYIYFSTDGTTFSLISGQSANGNTPLGPATMGTLFTSLAKATANPDNANTLEVDISESGGVLNGVSPTLAKAGANNLCYVDGEFISFADVAAGSFDGQYNLTVLYRHLFKSTNAAHAQGTNFAYLGQPTNIDSGIFRWKVPGGITNGQTVFFKFCSFNESLGEAQQPDSSVATYSFTVQGLSVQKGKKNRAVDTHLKTAIRGSGAHWAFPANIAVVGAAGLNGGNAFVYTGTGSAAVANTYSQSTPMPVTPGETVVISMYVDATFVTAGNPQIIALQTNGSALTVTGGTTSAQQTAGVAGQIFFSFDVPAGITAIIMRADMNGATVTSSDQVVFSNPQHEAGDTPTEYEEVTADEVSGVAIDFNSPNLNTPLSAHDLETSVTLVRNEYIVIGIVTFTASSNSDVLRFDGPMVMALSSFQLGSDEFEAEIIVDGSGAIGAQVSGGTQVGGTSFPVQPNVGGGSPPASSPTITANVPAQRYIPGDTSSHTYRLCLNLVSSGATGSVTSSDFEVTNLKTK